jgi:hypothetical protein
MLSVSKKLYELSFQHDLLSPSLRLVEALPELSNEHRVSHRLF